MRWLVAFGEDGKEHDSCRGYQRNAAQALHEAGRLQDLLERTVSPIPDPASRPIPFHGNGRDHA